MSRPSAALALALPLAVAGCGGFSPIADAGADASATDASGADLAALPSGPGPGPLGALPTGFCCSASAQCRGRLCAQVGGGPFYCADYCTANADCAGWTTQYTCDVGLHRCVPVNTPYACADGATYQHGGGATGACCDSARARAGDECLGGLCIRVGAPANPGVCTQGCAADGECPPGFACFAKATGQPEDQRRCWPAAAIGDPQATYSCR